MGNSIFNAYLVGAFFWMRTWYGDFVENTALEREVKPCFVYAKWFRVVDKLIFGCYNIKNIL